MLILILATQNSIMVPLELSFSLSVFDLIYYQVLGNLIDVAFIVDMVVMCLTSYMDHRGKEIKNSNKIIFRYITSSRFVSDFLAILGTGFLTYFYPKMKIFGIFKISRIFRLGTMLTMSQMSQDVK